MEEDKGDKGDECAVGEQQVCDRGGLGGGWEAAWWADRVRKKRRAGIAVGLRRCWVVAASQGAGALGGVGGVGSPEEGALSSGLVARRGLRGGQRAGAGAPQCGGRRQGSRSQSGTPPPLRGDAIRGPCAPLWLLCPRAGDSGGATKGCQCGGARCAEIKTTGPFRWAAAALSCSACRRSQSGAFVIGTRYYPAASRSTRSARRRRTSTWAL